MVLTAQALRKANTERLPLFKNAKGNPAHSQPDGSDWSLSDWFLAFAGELGELALEDAKEDPEGMAKELADCQTYLDILAYRLQRELLVGIRPSGEKDLQFLAWEELRAGVEEDNIFSLESDDLSEVPAIIAEHFHTDRPSAGAHFELLPCIHLVVMVAGDFANSLKKFTRGDTSRDDFRWQAEIQIGLLQLSLLYYAHFNEIQFIDLGQATVDKFNQVSERIGCEVQL